MYILLADSLFMWTAPPPVWNQTTPGTDAANIQTAVIQVLNGSTNVPVRWNYTLLAGQSITFTFFAIGDGISQPDDIGFVVSGLSPTINNRNDYPSRFSIDGTSEFPTVTIITVTERENATFQCRAQVGSETWAYNIRVEVTGKCLKASIVNHNSHCQYSHSMPKRAKIGVARVCHDLRSRTNHSAKTPN